MELVALDMSREDFRNADEVVWAYDYVPYDQHGGGTAAGSTTAGSTAAGAGSAGEPAGGAAAGRGVGEMRLVGFASADTGPLPTAAGAGGSSSSSGSSSSKGTRPGAPSNNTRAKGKASRRGRSLVAPAAAAAAAMPVASTPAAPPQALAQANQTTASTTAFPASALRASSLPGPGPTCNPTPVPTPTATVWFVAVHPSLRRTGLGRALLQRLAGGLAARGYGRVTLRATSKAAAFYDRLGLERSPQAPLFKGLPGQAQPLP
ncbi:hypothetical protein HYH03_014670 [Edaphochlamys debaryana]|uniref:N-acetyltransferase domain-containing protein n=1 Tax=Edaphochlamys debaryana TaxID=47281 RepID=A0A836BS10_9CHLO|nr:hypothetical protein HYH03_014670 [Edaphochlamys debaryana]|eukprot:KAG2486745.1 hypothetical protein HYH03_014670 [Edaphochlamys debaryana]